MQIVQQEIDNILFQDLKTKYGVEYIYLNQDIWNVISSLICSQLSVESGKNPEFSFPGVLHLIHN